MASSEGYVVDVQPSDLARFADDLIAAAICLELDKALTPGARVTWTSALRAIEREEPEGLVLGLAAIARTPGAAQTLVEQLLAGLANSLVEV